MEDKKKSWGLKTLVATVGAVGGLSGGVGGIYYTLKDEFTPREITERIEARHHADMATSTAATHELREQMTEMRIEMRESFDKLDHRIYRLTETISRSAFIEPEKENNVAGSKRRPASTQN